VSSDHSVGLEITPKFQSALDLIDEGRSVFITGRAGTGKSTLLRHVVETSDVAQVVLAPTGVAALNVGGQTIHRFFGFPPSVTLTQIESGGLFPRRNIDVIRNIQRIIIDEVSMVRADLLDCIDATLRRHGPSPGRTFGGIQMVLFGDPYQLPPVVVDEEASYFAIHYRTPYFFSSGAFASLDVETVELDRIYRQNDDEFIEILNAIRENKVTNEHFARLSKNVDTDFVPDTNDVFITLTTTNEIADRVNSERLALLDGVEYQRLADVTGDFPSTPTTDDLRFKVGAQVMMVTNDPLDRWVNGSLGIISGVNPNDGGDHAVSVHLLDSHETVTVRPHQWAVKQPRMSGGRLVYEEAGIFEQLPFTLAWAITIHKSQGKTFENVIIDLGRGTFSNGQLYVALSRARSLDGVVLRQQVRPRHVMVEDEVERFFGTRQLDARGLLSQRLAVMALNATGHTRTDRMVEVAVVILEGGEIVDEFDSMVNPLRDVTLSWEHGITATMASAAPQFSEIWAAIAPALEGSVLVSHGLPAVLRQLRVDLAAANLMPGSLGVGVCLQDVLQTSFNDACVERSVPLPSSPSALDRARAMAQLVLTLGDLEAGCQPAADLVTDSSPPRLQRRPGGPDDLIRFFDIDQTYGNSSEHYARVLARSLEDGTFAKDGRTLRDEFARSLKITMVEREIAHERFCASLIDAAARDDEMSEEEWELIQAVHSELAVVCPPRPEPRPDQVIELYRGMKVCFTGFPLEGPGNIEEFQAIARSLGLDPVRDATKQCRLVVAADRASLSKRAKAGRERGMLIDVVQFVDLIETGEIHDPPDEPEEFDESEERGARRGRSPQTTRAPIPRTPTHPVDLPKNRSIGRYTLEQLVSVMDHLDPDKSLEDKVLLDKCVEFLEFDQRSSQRIRKLSEAIDLHRGEEIGSLKARQRARIATASASDLIRKSEESEGSFVPSPGMGICFTGQAIIDGKRTDRKILQEAADKAGLLVQPSVNKNTHVLVFPDENSRSTQKVKKALAMGIEGMTVERFAELFMSTETEAPRT